ncbi:MAG TPA: hypothetical protein DEP32_11705 [Pseudomonas sp.]|nr:hypothetical protein [Pseudomonas sp.]MBB51225.1 hypothetical protein [Pseudomonadales bacterium]MBB52257.1 hypothetical protein [Pseudomonadales bacterium]HCA24818.1 hypothetical protein [Pseudomonas sp.]|tara:strand:+ start:9464 stop:9958 length:495 start_codon:yes stop_codon:yes gene_type:complete
MTASATQDPATVLTLLLVAAIVLPLLVVAYALSKSRRKNQALTAAYQGAVQDYHEAYRAAGNAHRAAEAARADLERSKANAAQALEQQQLNHDQELQALRDQLAPLGPKDLNTLREMADKLNLAANALHATQQFSDSRQAKNRASAGHRIADQLARARATQEAA